MVTLKKSMYLYFVFFSFYIRIAKQYEQNKDDNIYERPREAKQTKIKIIQQKRIKYSTLYKSLNENSV